MEKHPLVLAYMTARDRREAKKIADHLLTKRLAACVHMVDGMRSTYRWKGKRVQGKEMIVIAKTKRRLMNAFERAVKEVRSYEVPCIVFLPVIGGNRAYLEWTAKETM